MTTLALPVAYAQATPAQHEQAQCTVQLRLHLHFPLLPARAFARALTELQPDLLPDNPAVLSYPDLTRLVQYLAGAPEQPLLDPPLYGSWALELAQHVLLIRELAVRALLELTTQPAGRGGPHFAALLRRTALAWPLAERVVQAQPWGLPGSPRLPPGLPGVGSALDVPAVEHLLHQLAG